MARMSLAQAHAELDALRLECDRLRTENASLRDAASALQSSPLFTTDAAKPLPAPRYAYIVAQIRAGNLLAAKAVVNQVAAHFNKGAALALRSKLRRYVTV